MLARRFVVFPDADQLTVGVELANEGGVSETSPCPLLCGGEGRVPLSFTKERAGERSWLFPLVNNLSHHIIPLHILDHESDTAFVALDHVAFLHIWISGKVDIVLAFWTK